MKRLLHLIFATIAFVCFFLCLYAINWIWTIKKPAIDTATYAFDRSAEWLALADKTVDDVSGNLAVARHQVEIVQRSSSAATNGDQPGFLQGMIAQTVVRQMTPNINEMQQNIEKVTEASIVVDSILGSIQDVPIESMDRLDTDQVRKLQKQVSGVTTASWELGNLLNDGTPNDGESAAAKSARIAANLEQIIAMTNEFQKRVKALRQRVERVRGETLYWMNWTPTLATAALSWIAISQMVVIVVAVRGMRRSENV